MDNLNFNYMSSMANRNDFLLTELNQPSQETVDFISHLFAREPDPIFEQNWIHILSYLKFKSNIYSIYSPHGQSVLIFRDNKLHLFTADIQNPTFFLNFKQFASSLNLHSFDVLNISQSWLDKNLMLLHKTFSLVSVLSRSKEEVIYDLDLLTSLPSQAFNHLRQTRNRLLTSNKVCFEKINNSNLHVGFKLIEHWNSVQGYKYSKNKMDKEKFVLEKLVSFSYTHPELNLLLGKVGSFTCSLSIFFLHPQFLQYGIIYMLKGINRSEEGGIRGASDATYLHIFSQLKKLGAKFVNDGELGSEIGTRQYKLRYHPLRNLQSFDVELSI